jgi:ribosomal protein S18 acetylase RimI-like enzyme
MQATYKPVTIPDIETIVAMMRDFYAIDGYPMEVETSKKLFTEFLSDGNLGKAWLIFLENEIVGYAILTFVFSFEYGGRIAFLDELYIKGNARGKGIGKQTILFIQEEARKAHVKIIYLEIEPNNEKAQRLYLSSGFERHKRKLMQYKTNNYKL